MNSYTTINGCHFRREEQLANNPSIEALLLDGLIHRYLNLFVYEIDENCAFNKFEAIIKVDDTTPIWQQLNCLSANDFEMIKNEINRLEDMAIIECSNDPVQWSSPVYARQVDGRTKLLVDYKELNERTIPTGYYVPTVHEILGRIPYNQNVFSRVVIKDAYNQIVINKYSRHFTSFCTDYGHYQYTSMNGNLENSMEYLQEAVRVALNCDYQLNRNCVVFYLGQILIFTTDYATHLDILARVFGCLNQCNFKVGIKESCFLMNKIKYLGAIIDRNGVSISEETKKKIDEFACPQNEKELKSFLVLVYNYKYMCNDVVGFETCYRVLSKALNSRHLFGHEQAEAFIRLKVLFKESWTGHRDTNEDGFEYDLFYKSDFDIDIDDSDEDMDDFDEDDIDDFDDVWYDDTYAYDDVWYDDFYRKCWNHN